jgi:uncharacterized protein involved in exopolysaccharide biosynthesis
MEDRIVSDDQLDLEIDLSFLLSWWREIAVFTVLCVLLAGAVTQVLPRIYEAQSQVLILRRRTDVDFESRLSIETQGDTLTSTGPGAATYSDLVMNPVVAEDVRDRLDAMGADASVGPAALLRAVEAETKAGSDLLLINVRDADPARAAALATTWAEAYVAYVNQLYNEASTDYDAVVTQLSQRQAEYQTAQTALESFVALERISELERASAERTALVDRLQADRQVALTLLSDAPGSASVMSAYTDAVVSSRLFDSDQTGCESLVISQPDGMGDVVETTCPPAFSSGLERRLADLEADHRRLEQYRRQLADVELLWDQLQRGGDAASGVLAVALVKAQLLDVTRGLPAELSLQLQAGEAVTSAAQLADLEALEMVLVDAIANLEETIEEQAAALAEVSYGLEALDVTADPVGMRLTALQGEIQLLQADIERQTAEKMKLTLERDLAWESFTTLARKEAELRVSNELPASDVRLAAPAVVPSQPVSPRTMLIVAGAAATGLLLAVVGAFLLDHLDREPFFSRREDRSTP